MGGRPRVFIADDHHLLVQALRTMLEPQFDVVGEAFSGDELLRKLPGTRADALLLDLQMPGRSGLELLPDLTRGHPALKILIVTMHVDRVPPHEHPPRVRYRQRMGPGAVRHSGVGGIGSRGRRRDGATGGRTRHLAGHSVPPCPPRTAG